LLLARAQTAPPDSPLPIALIADPASSGLETVLLAEDEDSVRLLAIESLERRGYRVLAAASGEEALKLESGYGPTIHLLVTDVVMPGMKGPELAERIRAKRPGVRVLLMSGYAADVVMPGDLREATLLSKPFSPGALLNAVRSLLDAPGSSAAVLRE
jgi:two-component system, cell cycle sensor histidine kinase and response regulator CckA